MGRNTFVIGSRGSELALWQAHHVRVLLLERGFSSEIRIIQTEGDIASHLSFDKIEGKGFFTKEIEKALLDEEIDIAVHSHKDLQTTSPNGLTIAALSERANPADVLLIRSEKVRDNRPLLLPAAPIIGTSSSRRKAQLLSLVPDAIVHDIRGNVPRRIEKLRQGEFDAIVIAKAGIDRLALSLEGIKEVVLNVDQMVPAPAQGVLAIQCRTEDMEVLAMLKQIHVKSVESAIHIEREILKRMDGGCHLPLGVYVNQEGAIYEVFIAYAPELGSPVKKLHFSSDDPEWIIEHALFLLTS